MRSSESARKKKKRSPVCMIIMPGPFAHLEVIGLNAVPNRMDPILRFPGESLSMMERRALQSVRGGGNLVVFPMYRE